MADAPVPVRASSAAPVKRRWRYTPWGSIVLAPDFYLGVPAGIAIGTLPAFNNASAGMATTLLISFAGALVAIAAVVVAVKTILVTLVGPEYIVVLERAPGGVKGSAKPFIIVAWVCIVGALCSFAAALAWPAIPAHSWGLRWFAFSTPAALTAWGLLGTAMLVELGAFHLEQRSKLMKAIRDARQHNNQSSRSALRYNLYPLPCMLIFGRAYGGEILGDCSSPLTAGTL